MAWTTPSRVSLIRTPCRFANANGSDLTTGGAAASVGAATGSRLLGLATIGRRGGRWRGLGLLGRGFGERGNFRPIAVADQRSIAAVQLALQLLDVAILRVRLEARVHLVVQDYRADEHHEIRLRALRLAGAEQPA